jgi:hypothetical protein
MDIERDDVGLEDGKLLQRLAAAARDRDLEIVFVR